MAGRKKTRTSKRGEGSFRRTTSGSLEYRFSYKDPLTDQPRRKSFTGADEKECLDKAERWMQKIERDRRGVQTNATIVEILRSRYQTDFELNHLGEPGFARNMDSLKRFEKSKIGKKPIYDIRRSDIDEFLKSLTIYSNSVIEKIYRQLRLAFRIAMERQIITVNLMTAHDMRCPRSEKADKKVRALNIEEQKLFVDQLQHDKVPFGRNDYRLQLFIELYSGMRMGEINALRRQDIDLKKNVIHVNATVSRGMNNRSYVKDGTKTYNGLRDIPISKKLRPYLEKALKERRKNPGGLLFYDPYHDDVITTSQVNCYFRRVCVKAGIPVCGQHTLRHTFATRCIESGIPPVVLKTWLGHKDIHVTLDTYTDVFREMDHGAVEKLDKYIDAM